MRLRVLSFPNAPASLDHLCPRVDRLMADWGSDKIAYFFLLVGVLGTLVLLLFCFLVYTTRASDAVYLWIATYMNKNGLSKMLLAVAALGTFPPAVIGGLTAYSSVRVLAIGEGYVAQPACRIPIPTAISIASPIASPFASPMPFRCADC